MTEFFCRRWLRAGFLCSLALVWLFTCGCRSTKAESSRAAAVILTNCTPAEITLATKTVFAAQKYEAGKASGTELVFQKPGGFARSFFYGDWYSGPVWRRVKVYQQPLDPTLILLDCDLYLVQEPEDPFFQKERKMQGKDRECQKLLDEVASSLARGAKSR